MKQPVLAIRPCPAGRVLPGLLAALLGASACAAGIEDVDTEEPGGRSGAGGSTPPAPELRADARSPAAPPADAAPAPDGAARDLAPARAADGGADGPPSPAAETADGCPVLSHQRGFYDRPFALKVTCPAGTSQEASYTLDGSDPRSSSTARTLRLPGEIAIDPASTAGRQPVPGVTLRLATRPFAQVWASVHVHTFIFPQAVLTQKNVAPTGAFWDTVMDPRIVTDPEFRDKMLPGLTAIPSVSVVMSDADLFGRGGIHDPRGANLTNRDLEKSASAELIYPRTDPRYRDLPGFQVTGAAKIQGGWSRLQGTMDTDHKQSFTIKFKDGFGPKSLKYPVMESSPLEVVRKTAATRYDRLVLRSSFNESLGAVCDCFDRANFTMLRDEFVRASYVAMTGYGARGTFVHLYLNGIYWGLYGLLERPDHKFQAIHFGGDDTGYFSWRNKKGVINDDAARTGLLRWNEAHTRLDRPLSEFAKVLDLDSFADWLIAGWWSGVADIQWYVGAPLAGDGRFRYFFWDAEDTFGLGNRAGKGARINSGGSVSNGVLHGYGDPVVRENQLALALLRNPDFVRLLTARTRKATGPGGGLSDTEALARWDTLVKHTELAMLAEYARWGDERSPAMTPRHWRGAVDRVRGYVQGNADRLVQAMKARGFWRE